MVTKPCPSQQIKHSEIQFLTSSHTATAGTPALHATQTQPHPTRCLPHYQLGSLAPGPLRSPKHEAPCLQLWPQPYPCPLLQGVPLLGSPDHTPYAGPPGSVSCGCSFLVANALCSNPLLQASNPLWRDLIFDVWVSPHLDPAHRGALPASATSGSDRTVTLTPDTGRSTTPGRLQV